MSAIPKDFTDALKQNGLHEFFMDCTGPHQREYLKWISEAKKPETRIARIAKAMKTISAKRDEEAAKIGRRAKP
jgi:uncharacterized protein YdeI (YjbR/CyaY-like superfamily)